MNVNIIRNMNINSLIFGQRNCKGTNYSLHIIAAGGSAVREKEVITGNLVQEYNLGNTKIKIYDSAYVGKSKEEIEQILRRIAEISMRAN